MRTKDKDKFIYIKEYIEDYYENNRDFPNLEEIACGVNMSRSNLHRYVKDMQVRGDLTYSKGKYYTEKIEKMIGGNINVALVGDIACGQPTFAEENIEEYFSLPESLVGSGKFFLLRANGESMINVGIENGDLVLVRQQNFANPGEIVVALCEDSEATLKRYYPEDDCIRLHPENDNMDDIYVDHCIIQGVAVKVLKDLS